MKNPPPLSKRAEQLKDDPTFSTASSEAFYDMFHAENNKDGYINLGLADNVLMAQEMCDKVRELQAKHPIEPRHLNYTDFAGDPQFRRALAHLLQNHVFSSVVENGDASVSVDLNKSVNPDHLIVGNGSGSLLELLGSVICDEGEYIMIPAPLYRSFPSDFGKRFHCNVLPVYLPYDAQKKRFELTLKVVQECFTCATIEGKTVRAFLLCSPNNPTGEIYSESVMRQLMDWCEETNIHFISDEVYALSIFNNNKTNHGDDDDYVDFVSAGRLMLDDKYGDRGCQFTHLIYSFSKDFVLSGFRVGVLYSHNANVLQAFRSCSYFVGVSSHTQQVMSHLLKDDEFIRFFTRTNRRRMAESYTSAVNTLQRHNVKYVEARGGMFLFVYLGNHIRKWMKKSSDYQITLADERAFWNHIFRQAKVNISAGETFFCTQDPGWFRICFTAAPADILHLAFNRIFKSIEE